MITSCPVCPILRSIVRRRASACFLRRDLHYLIGTLVAYPASCRRTSDGRNRQKVPSFTINRIKSVGRDNCIFSDYRELFALLGAFYFVYPDEFKMSYTQMNFENCESYIWLNQIMREFYLLIVFMVSLLVLLFGRCL